MSLRLVSGRRATSSLAASPIPELLLPSTDTSPSAGSLGVDRAPDGAVGSIVGKVVDAAAVAAADAAVDVGRALVADVAVGSDGMEGRPEEAASPAWDRVAALLRVHGLQGLALARHARHPFLPDRLVRELDSGRTSVGLRTTLLLEAGRRAREALRSEGIPSLFYKGAALVAGGVYASPGERPMGDVDLLVPPSRAGEAMEALRRAGFRPWSEWEPRRGDWSDAAALTDTRSPRGVDVTVDLHWRIGYDRLRYGPDIRATEGEGDGILWRGADGGSGLPRDEPHLIVLLEHFVKHLHAVPHLLGLADVARLAARIEDWSEVLALMEARPARPGLALVLDVLRVEWGVRPIPEVVAARTGAERWTRPARRSLTPGRLLAQAEERGRLGGLLVRWSLLGSPRRALREVRSTILPPASWLRGRYGGERGPLPSLLLRYWSEVACWLAGRGVSPVSPNQEFLE